MKTSINEPKRIPAVSVIISETDESLALTFANGKTLELNAKDLPKPIRDYAILHGLKQKLVDAAAIARDTETGKPASIDDKYEEVKRVLNRLLMGSWNSVREGGQASGGLLLTALCEIFPTKSREQLKATLDTKTLPEKNALRTNPKVAVIIDKLRAKSTNVDSDALLDELGDATY